MPIKADRWMLDYPGLEPSNGQLRIDLDQLEVENHQRVQMTVDGIRSILPSVPNWGNQPIYNRSLIEVSAIAERVQQFGGSPGLYDYIKAVLADQVYPVVRPVYNKATHVGLGEFVKRLDHNSSDRRRHYALQFTKVENGIAVRWFDKSVVLPFVHARKRDDFLMCYYTERSTIFVAGIHRRCSLRTEGHLSVLILLATPVLLYLMVLVHRVFRTWSSFAGDSSAYR